MERHFKHHGLNPKALAGRATVASPIVTVLLLALHSPAVTAQTTISDPPQRSSLDNVTIIGHRRDVKDIPGSAYVVDQEELKSFLSSDVMRVLRAVPGVYVQEEDGYGLRPNIGIRGSGLDRSARIALLEDGVLIAPAPYAASSAYYFPTQRRMYALEVLKGPASVAVGPRTTGGAINLISTPIPDTFGGNLDLRMGENGTNDAHINLGNRGQRFSWLVETVQSSSDGFKRIDGPAGTSQNSTGFNISDYLVKFQLDSDPAATLYQSLRLKAGYTDQVSNETYLGLTVDDFTLSPYRQYAASAGDQFRGEHEQLQLSYVIESDSNWQGTVTAYRNNFKRDWFKLRSVNGTGISAVLDDSDTYATEYAYLTGNDSPDDAIVKRHNARQYFSQGVQAEVSWDFDFNETALTLRTGVRIHEDEEDRLQQEDGFRMQDSTLIQTSTGAPGSQANRISGAKARSIFIDTEIRAGNWILTPGARFENIDLRRRDFSRQDPTRAQGATRIRDNSVSVLIPGMGALYRLGDRWRLLAGVHKGFNPPNPGSSASEESSLNVEAGTRFSGDRLNVEAIYFINDYKNLVGTVTASTGGDGAIGDQFDGGEATVQGLELNSDYTFTDLGNGRFDLPLKLQYTWTSQAQFDNAFDSNFQPWGNVDIGDQLPYIPEHQLRVSTAIEHERFGLSLSANYVGKMRTVAGQGPYIAAESIDSRVVWDMLARWHFTESLSTYIKVDNLFDDVYVAARRPAGLRPGLDRTAYIGLSYRL
ncbi:MAG: TonB-dependent receptor [Gammaproteobacteria bacterium]|nr:TonB-dependent receptor [Gammaproteobacteria bacterium]